MKATPPNRADYRWQTTIATRWMDNDVYGHVNNVIYYSYFDTAVNRFLIDQGVLDIQHGPVIGFVVDTACRYHSPIAFPDEVHAGIRVAKIGRTSVRYEVGIFRNEDTEAAADGHFVHVYVDRSTNRPTPIPQNMRTALSAIVI